MPAFAVSGGAPLDRHTADDFAAAAHCQVVEGYGLSEASPVTHVGPLDGTARPGFIGSNQRGRRGIQAASPEMN